jgi:hypothetical protein
MMKKILILAANPKGTSPLRIDEEVREIQAGLERSRQREQFEIAARWAVRWEDVRRAMIDFQPQIVHFSGHGEGERGIIFEDAAGGIQQVGGNSLHLLFENFPQVECVFLNACYSEHQAIAINQTVACVVGMSQAIIDRAAIEFAVAFYDGVLAGWDYDRAFALGRSGILNPMELSKPVFLSRQGLAATSPATPEALSDQPSSRQGEEGQVFISYRSQEPDVALAGEFHGALTQAGYRVFMAGRSIHLGEDWVQRIDRELAQCDYFLLLLSERSALSEMVTEEVRRAKQLRDQTGKPLILPIRVDFPIDSPLNYDLRGYLQRIQQREWRDGADTQPILTEILALLGGGDVRRKAQEIGPPPETSGEVLDPPSIVESFAVTESVQMPPLPVAEPELPGGQVDLASQFYVERGSIEAQCYEAIAKPGALIRIKAPRQMGKTSLMSRVLRQAEQQGCLGVPLSFQIADSVVFGDLDKFLRWFAASVGRRLKLPNRLNDYWDEVFGSKDNCTAYFEEYLLQELQQPLVLCLDEVDMVFEHESVAADFFGLLRNWHEMGKTSHLWKRFRLVVVHSTEVYIPMKINQSPFNVGLPIELPEFSAEQVQDLAARHGLRWNTSQIGRLMGMIGGHPYLVRLALYHVARRDLGLEDLLRQAPTESGLYADHLRRHLWNLEQHPSLAAAVRRLVQSDVPVRLESVVAFQLHSMGLVDLQGNEVRFRSELYRAYFGDRLGVDRLDSDRLGGWS